MTEIIKITSACGFFAPACTHPLFFPGVCVKKK